MKADYSAAGSLLDPALLQAELWSDGELDVRDFAIDTAIALRDGGHWGQGYPEPLFDGEFDVLGWRIVGERHATDRRAALHREQARPPRHRSRRAQQGQEHGVAIVGGREQLAGADHGQRRRRGVGLRGRWGQDRGRALATLRGRVGDRAGHSAARGQ